MTMSPLGVRLAEVGARLEQAGHRLRKAGRSFCQFHVWRWGGWIRFFGYGIAVRRERDMPLLFSERNGYTIVFRLFGWVVRPLGRTSWV